MNKNNSGFVLVTFVTLFMASFSVIWLLHLNSLHRQQLEFEGRYQYQLHQARVQLFWLARDKPEEQSWLAWQTSLNVQQWLTALVQQGIAAQIEINPVSLVVETGSPRQASQLSERMVHSIAEGSAVKLQLPEDTVSGENDLWLDRHYRPHLPMATNLVSNSTKGVNIGTLEGDQVHFHQLQSSQLNSEHLTATVLETQHIRQGQALNVTNLQAVKVTNEQTAAVAAEILTSKVGSAAVGSATLENSTVATATAEISSAFNIAAEQVKAYQPVQLQGDARVRLNTIYSQLAGLEQSIYYCIEETLWCLAPVKPNAVIQSCKNCQLEQQAIHFEAEITINVGLCIHGCGVRLSAPTGVAVSCSAPSIPARQQGQLRCQLSSTLANMDELAFDLQVDIYSEKNAAVYTRLITPIRWQVSALSCAPENHTVTVGDSAPTMSYTFYLPEHPGGELYFWSGMVYQQCRASGQTTFMRCELFASCGTNGQWQTIEGRCSCLN